MASELELDLNIYLVEKKVAKQKKGVLGKGRSFERERGGRKNEYSWILIFAPF